MKSTIYIVEITKQKNEKYVGRNPVAWSPLRLVSTKKFSACLLKSVLPFLTNQAARFTSRGIGRSYFSGNFLLSFLFSMES